MAQGYLQRDQTADLPRGKKWTGIKKQKILLGLMLFSLEKRENDMAF